MSPHRGLHAAAARAGHGHGADRPGEPAGGGEGEETELDTGREAARRGDVARLGELAPTQLGQTVGELTEPLRAGMLGAVISGVGGRVAQSEVTREVHDADAAREELRHLVGRHLVREAEEDQIHTLGRLGRGDVLEAQRAQTGEVGMGRPDRLAHEVDARHPHQLHVRVEGEASDDLATAVAAAADQGGLETSRAHGSGRSSDARSRPSETGRVARRPGRRSSPRVSGPLGRSDVRDLSTDRSVRLSTCSDRRRSRASGPAS